MSYMYIVYFVKYSWKLCTTNLNILWNIYEYSYKKWLAFRNQPFNSPFPKTQIAHRADTMTSELSVLESVGNGCCEVNRQVYSAKWHYQSFVIRLTGCYTEWTHHWSLCIFFFKQIAGGSKLFTPRTSTCFVIYYGVFFSLILNSSQGYSSSSATAQPRKWFAWRNSIRYFRLIYQNTRGNWCLKTERK